jgi:hypothetical protein
VTLAKRLDTLEDKIEVQRGGRDEYTVFTWTVQATGEELGRIVYNNTRKVKVFTSVPKHYDHDEPELPSDYPRLLRNAVEAGVIPATVSAIEGKLTS